MSATGSQVKHIAVSGAQAGQRLDNWLLARLKGVPKSRVYKLLRTGQVRVNGKRAKPVYRLEAGDEVRIPPVRTAQKGETPRPGADLQARLAGAILYESAGLLVLDKPAGLAVHGGSGITLGVIEALSAIRPGQSLHLVHRLDRPTSGCLVIAKERGAMRVLNRLFRQGGVTKQYLALLKGQWTNGPLRVDTPLMTARRGGERLISAAAEGRAALTHFKAVENGPHAALVQAEIQTGRTHQIRVHAAHLGRPVAGDDKYGDRSFNRTMAGLGLKRLFLHAQRIAFELPGAEPVDVSAPLPDELRSVLDALGPG